MVDVHGRVRTEPDSFHLVLGFRTSQTLAMDHGRRTIDVSAVDGRPWTACPGFHYWRAGVDGGRTNVACSLGRPLLSMTCHP